MPGITPHQSQAPNSTLLVPPLLLHLIQKISRKRSISDVNKISLFSPILLPSFPLPSIPFRLLLQSQSLKQSPSLNPLKLIFLSSRIAKERKKNGIPNGIPERQGRHQVHLNYTPRHIEIGHLCRRRAQDHENPRRDARAASQTVETGPSGGATGTG